MWRFVLASLLLGSVPALSNDAFPGTSTPHSSATSMPNTPYAAALDQTGLGTPPQSPSQFSAPNATSQLLTQPPPGGWAMANAVSLSASATPSANSGRYDSAVMSSDHATFPTTPSQIVEQRPIESTWYYRFDSFLWNERVGGADVVNESGPVSTVGYMRRNGPERFRLEVFGGTVAYDGNAQYQDTSGNWVMEPYHQSSGTDYLGCRGEYDLLIEPSSWSHARLLFGVGTRFWIRDLHDGFTPSGMPVGGYQETWWTFYPYVGLETKLLEQPGLQWFGSARFGLTPFTYQNASGDGTDLSMPVYPKCGVTAQAELGVAYRRFTASAFTEVMTWGESDVVRDSFQPDSRMFTVGGRLSYSF